MPTGEKTENHSSAELCQQIEDMRRELVGDKMRIIELQDEIQMRQTDHADAISLLGQAELLLEGKIEYILKLDHGLTERIRELEAECDRKSAEIERRGEVIAAVEARDQQNRAERDALIKDLSERLEQANQEVGKAHALASQIDQDRAAQVVALTASKTREGELQEALAAVQKDLTEARREADELAQKIEREQTVSHRLSGELEQNQTLVGRLQTDLQAEQAEVHRIKSSVLWKLSRPWRGLFGPKP